MRNFQWGRGFTGVGVVERGRTEKEEGGGVVGDGHPRKGGRIFAGCER